MEKKHQVESLKIEDGLLYLSVDGISISVRLADVSAKLSNASPEAQNTYKVSPSGYGIHWAVLDEDLSIGGLLKAAGQLKS